MDKYFNKENIIFFTVVLVAIIIFAQLPGRQKESMKLLYIETTIEKNFAVLQFHYTEAGKLKVSEIDWDKEILHALSDFEKKIGKIESYVSEKQGNFFVHTTYKIFIKFKPNSF